jgi:hypothetical protein
MFATVTLLLLVVLAIMIYMLPTVVAMGRKHRNASAIAALNLLTGWTFLGWVASLVWAITSNVEPSQSACHKPSSDLNDKLFRQQYKRPFRTR